MAQNIEIKLRVPDLDEIEGRAARAGAGRAGVLLQRDTFFRSPTGRLKLREIEGQPSELIAYLRDDSTGPRSSDYTIYRTDEPLILREVLARSLGLVGVVAKSRTLLLWRNVRIHLDRVDGLGEFVELESVVGEVDAETAGRHLQQLLDLLELRSAEIVPVAYIDLLATKAES